MGVGSVSDSRFVEGIRNLPYWRRLLIARRQAVKKLIDWACKYKTDLTAA